MITTDQAVSDQFHRASRAFDNALEAARNGKMPDNSPMWALTDPASLTEDTVAHRAAAMLCLPRNFTQWELADRNGWTVAQEVAKREVAGTYADYPEKVRDQFESRRALFDRALKDALDGKLRGDDTRWLYRHPDPAFNKATVAHVAARSIILPLDCCAWSSRDGDGNPVAHEAARYIGMPRGFKLWAIKDKYDDTVAHVAAMTGRLPRDFDRWKLRDAYDNTVAHVAAIYHPLPDDFDHWGLKNADGDTPAHVAAKFDNLPHNFRRWGRLNSAGQTVAHVAAMYCGLPAGFKRWDMPDSQGVPVAITASICGRLPQDFDQWGIADDSGRTVAHVETLGWRQFTADSEVWALADKRGWSVAHEAANSGRLPSGFNQWELADRNGWTVAHEHVTFAPLPHDFTLWALTDSSGESVAHVAYKNDNLPHDFAQRDLLKLDGTNPVEDLRQTFNLLALMLPLVMLLAMLAPMPDAEASAPMLVIVGEDTVGYAPGGARINIPAGTELDVCPPPGAPLAKYNFMAIVMHFPFMCDERPLFVDGFEGEDPAPPRPSVRDGMEQ